MSKKKVRVNKSEKIRTLLSKGFTVAEVVKALKAHKISAAYVYQIKFKMSGKKKAKAKKVNGAGEVSASGLANEIEKLEQVLADLKVAQTHLNELSSN